MQCRECGQRLMERFREWGVEIHLQFRPLGSDREEKERKMTAPQISSEETGQSREDHRPQRLLHIDRKGLVALTIADLIGQSVNIIGLKRSGKTTTGTVLVEEWMGLGLPMSVIDRQNEYWPLAEHFPCVVAGR
jgi:hypothetical protein